MNVEEQAHAVDLAEELLTDIELSRLPIDQQVLKASRLARLVGDREIYQWLSWERNSFPDSPEGDKWRRITARAYTDESESVYAGAVRLAPMVETLKSELQQLKLPSLSGDMLIPTTNNIMQRIGETRNTIVKFESILSAVSAQIHTFVTRTYYAVRFSSRQDSMFERAKVEIDRQLVGLGEDALERIDSAHSNLQMGDAESIAGAMNSVRRLIDAFADQVFPPVAEPRRDGSGNEVKLGTQQKLNRVKAYIDDNAQSTSRAKRLKRAISDIYDRVSTGVHSDVAAAEAEYLFLSTYILLGEILALSGNTEEPTAEVHVE